MRRSIFVLALCLPSFAACSSTSSSATPGPASGDDAGVSSTGDDDAAPTGPDPAIVARPYVLKVPAGYDATKPAPLVIGLHGYGTGDNAQAFEKWFQLAPEASKRGWLYALPSGTIDQVGNPFWNGTDVCCDFEYRKVDDVAYIGKVIDDVARTHAVDRSRVFVVGVSGGGFMAHRLACDLSEKIAAVVSVSGATWKMASICKPTSKLALLELQGDQDEVVTYTGGSFEPGDPVFPGAVETVDHWKTYNGCTGDLHATGATLDLESEVAGAETQVQTYDACPRGDVELWTAKGGHHAPLWTPTFVPTIFDWLAAHPKAP